MTATYKDPVFSEADPYFGNEIVRQVYADVAKDVPSATIYGQHYTEINGFVKTAIQKFFTGSMSAADALKEAAAGIRQQTGLK